MYHQIKGNKDKAFYFWVIVGSFIHLSFIFFLILPYLMRLKIYNASFVVYAMIGLSALAFVGISIAQFLPFERITYYQESTAFIQPSKMEGLGRSTIEAKFYGCPVVARNCGGTLDFIENGKTGYLWNTEEECVSLLEKVSIADNNGLIIMAPKYVAEKYR